MSQRQVFRVTDLSGGMNPDQNPVLIEDNEAVEIMNFRIDKFGSLKSREGSTLYFQEGDGDILQIGRWSDGTSAPLTQILYTVGTTIRRVNTSATGADVMWGADHVMWGPDPVFYGTEGTFTDLATGVSPEPYSMFYPFQEFVVYTQDGPPLVYDGTGEFETLGIEAPAAAPTGVVSGTGLTGVFSYAYTGYNSTTGWESNPSPIYTTADLSNQGIELTLGQHPHPNVDRLRIYRTTAGGATLFPLDDIPNPVAADTTYLDDGSVSLSIVAAEFDNDPPPNLERVAYHKGYLFGTIGSTLYWSKPLRFNAWPFENSTSVPFESNDTITAIKSFQDALLVFGNLNTILVAGDGGNWSLIRQDVEVGCVGQDAIAEVGNNLIFMSYQGLRTFPGFDIFAPKLNRTLNEFSVLTRRATILGYVPEEYSIWAQLGGLTWSVSLINQGLVRNSARFSRFLPGGVDGRAAHLRVRDNRILLYGGRTDPDSMQGIWRSKIYQLSNPEKMKFLRRIGLFAVAGTGTGSLATLTLGDTERSYTVPLASVDGDSTTTWDFTWGDPWASEAASYFIGSLPAQSLLGRILQITITGDAYDAPFEIISPISIEFRESDRFLGAP